MKKTVLFFSRFTSVWILALLFGGTASAQKTPSSKEDSHDVTIHIIERNGNDIREIDRTYRATDLSSTDRDKLVTKLVDSLKATRKGDGPRQLTITVEDTNGNRVVTRERSASGSKRTPGDAYVQRGKLPRNNNDSWNDSNWRYEFRRGIDSAADQLRRLKFDFPQDFDRQLARPFDDWSRNFTNKASTIRGLEAYPNNPDHDQLNIRFTAPSTGDVSIIVTNPKGKEVAKREIKNFTGDFVGQIELGKKAQGIYFVTVTQNDDGAVKRIVVGETK